MRFLALVAGTLLVLVSLEAILRTLPVAGAARSTSVDAENPIARFEPGTEFTWSRDWNFSIVNQVRVNNFGFVSDFDYDEDATDPLVAVIGDSFVEAFMVPFRETCAGRLATDLDGRARVYAFGVSGAPLSQYLAFAEYARSTFRPGALAIIVISNDYDESMLKYGRKPGMHQFVEQSDGRLLLRRSDWVLRRSALYRWAKTSALAGYVVRNLDVRALGRNVGRAVFGRVDRRGREPDSKRAVDAFLDTLPAAAGLTPERIAFVVDGIRPALYDAEERREAGNRYEGVMRRYFMNEAALHGYAVIDMQPLLVEHYRMQRRRFEWAQDYHWNSLGHSLCADALLRSQLLAREALSWTGTDWPAGN